MRLADPITEQLQIRPEQTQTAIELLDSGATLPFIARYRKEATGGLDEDQLRRLTELLARLRSLEERRQTVLKTIQEQGQLTPELESKIMAAATLTALEDLYQPYKPKRRTRASLARDKGLQPLADLILQQPRRTESLDRLAAPYLNDQAPTVEEAWAGARDIVAETVSDNPDVRRLTREKAAQWGILRAEKIEKAIDDRRVYESYYAFEYRVDRLRPHQVLALNRGEAEKILRVHIEISERDWSGAVHSVFRPDPLSPLAGQLEAAIADAAERLLLPAIERDLRRNLTETAETHAIDVFAANLRALLGQPPLSGHTILGIDPGFRTGSKVAVVDPTGKLLATATIYPHQPQKRWDESLKILSALIARHKVSLLALGNGTASRETETLAAEIVRSSPGVKYLIVSEAGASVYSASALARRELPDLDVSLRGAVSIARRVQDPLAELVKIDPRSIGVGLYQHDLDQKRLSDSLTGVVESVVNAVGVDVNTASPALLTYVSGIGPKLAAALVAYRDSQGPFSDRHELRSVPGMGPKAFEQSAGFLRVRGGANPLDASAIHPESYPAAQKVLELAGLDLHSTPLQRKPAPESKPALDHLLLTHPMKDLATGLGVGEQTLADIFDQLVRPGRDPRQDAPAPILRSDVLKMEDLSEGMRLKGSVRNVVDFGAFVDIGVKQDGLLHRSQIPPGTQLKVGDVIEVEIQKVDPERGRISLGMV
jgi:protein Tex